VARVTGGLALVAVMACLATDAPAAEPTPPQALFRKSLLSDARTTGAVKRLLRTGAGFVDAHVAFSDLTGDGKADAVVVVRSPGAAGAVAVYLFSTDGAPRDSNATSDLRVVFRSQELYRATTLVRPGALVVRTPIFAQDEDLCCASKLLERDYRWDAKHRTFTRTDLREIKIG